MKNEKYVSAKARSDRAHLRRVYAKLNRGEKRLFTLLEYLFELADMLPICEYEYRELLDFSHFAPFYEIEEKFYEVLEDHGVKIDRENGRKNGDAVSETTKRR